MRPRLVIHSKQFMAMALIAISGLLSGSLVSVKSAKQTASPKTTSTPQARIALFSKAAPSPQVIPIGPSPSPSAATQPKTSPKPSAAPQAAVSKVRSDFKWAVTMLPFPLADGNDKLLPEQFRLAKELGVTSVRIEYAVNNEAANVQAIDLAHQNNLQLVFIIPFGPNDIFSDSDLSNSAYRYVSDIVAKHKGQVQVWQLATEVASVAIIDGGHYGVDRVDYPESKYKAVSTWLKAATKAVKDADPGARRLINDQWVHVGFFDRYFAEGGDTDIIGWNWFSDMGTDWNNPVINSKTRQKYALMNKLKSFHRDIWITEANRRGGSNDGNTKAQADYIQTMAEKAYAEPAIKSFSVFDLVEDQKAPAQERGYGITMVSSSTNWISGLKDAYSRYQALIKAKK